jgi:hypothetical protein
MKMGKIIKSRNWGDIHTYNGDRKIPIIHFLGGGGGDADVEKNQKRKKNQLPKNRKLQ